MPLSSLHPSPVGRQAAGTGTHRLPMHRAEQHWLSIGAGAAGRGAERAAAHPPLHPSEQHSLGSSHRVPSAWQYCEQVRVPMRPAGSHRTLQQLPRMLQATPGAAHALEGRQ